MDFCVAGGALDVEALGIAGDLADGFLAGLGHLGVGSAGWEVLQFEDIGVLYVGIDGEQRLQVDVGIATEDSIADKCFGTGIKL